MTIRRLDRLLRSTSVRCTGIQLAALLLAALNLPIEAVAQLRPLDPIRWDLFSDYEWMASTGLGWYEGQRASLAGTEGRLLELGIFHGAWRQGRIVLEGSGTLYRSFEDQDVFAEPQAGTRSTDGDPRSDWGDIQLATLVRLTGGDRPAGLALRFGVRLPNTDNTEGLGRDQTDFFASMGGRLASGRLTSMLELGLTTLGTRSPDVEQVDPILVFGTTRYDLGSLVGLLEYTGQFDPRSSPSFRGAEDLQEARVGVVFGQQNWIKVLAVKGLSTFSPDYGLQVIGGVLRE